MDSTLDLQPGLLRNMMIVVCYWYQSNQSLWWIWFRILTVFFSSSTSSHSLQNEVEEACLPTAHLEGAAKEADRGGEAWGTPPSYL